MEKISLSQWNVQKAQTDIQACRPIETRDLDSGLVLFSSRGRYFEFLQKVNLTFLTYF